MLEQWDEKRILIWGKTYPELSTKYKETVCTGGALENGEFIRLYPIPFRYLSDDLSFSKYQWIRAKVKKSKEDPRPESFKIDTNSIVVEEKIPSDKFEWFNRRQVVLKNQNYIFDSVEALIEENRRTGISIGFVRPFKIVNIFIEDRPHEDYLTFARKFEEAKKRNHQMELFGDLSIAEIKTLQFISQRIKVQWNCYDPSCGGHTMAILDWELYELVRKAGINIALERIKTILNLANHNIGFFLGNFRLHPKAFSIGAIWYPQRSNLAPNLKLF
jgi:hypothetical protein